MKKRKTKKEGDVERWTSTITLKNGRKIYAWQYGLKAFPIRVPRTAA